ncbi:hypothetical protein PRZ48_008033 [Zasmidium cellare]|uniref:Uncharacterized protein n=1 Tax=Zasmidium cellare TaxID=395010 RepID=A0ABR0EEE3_ZASCE|nr:hypothetical protein PRZ48_008033 [Zasmidium cellare]
MSYYNDAASELGRKLTLGDRGSPTDDMRTRSQAKRESQSKGKSSSSRAHASSSSKGAGKGKAPAEPTRRQPRRESTRRARDASPDDSDDDDEDDSEDEDSDDNDPPPPQTPAMSQQEGRRLVVLAIMSAFEPNRGSPDPSVHLSPWEFSRVGASTRVNELRYVTYPIAICIQSKADPQHSRRYLAVAETQAALVRSQTEVARFTQDVPLNGTFWGQTVAADLRLRAESAMRLFQGHITPQRDALDTIREYRRIFDSVEGILRTFPLASMHRDSKVTIIHLLTYILQQILLTHEDVGRVVQSGPVYAGTTDAYNLFSRFKSNREDWNHFLQVLRRLIQLDSTLFEDPSRRLLQHCCQLLDWHNTQGRISNQSATDFMTQFKWVVQGLVGSL